MQHTSCLVAFIRMERCGEHLTMDAMCVSSLRTSIAATIVISFGGRRGCSFTPSNPGRANLSGGPKWGFAQCVTRQKGPLVTACIPPKPCLRLDTKRVLGSKRACCQYRRSHWSVRRFKRHRSKPTDLKLIEKHLESGPCPSEFASLLWCNSSRAMSHGLREAQGCESQLESLLPREPIQQPPLAVRLAFLSLNLRAIVILGLGPRDGTMHLLRSKQRPQGSCSTSGQPSGLLPFFHCSLFFSKGTPLNSANNKKSCPILIYIFFPHGHWASQRSSLMALAAPEFPENGSTIRCRRWGVVARNERPRPSAVL